MSDSPRDYFTLVFEGDLCAFKGNPLKTETAFGTPLVVSAGDVIAERDALKKALREAPRPLVNPSAADLIPYMNWFFKVRLPFLNYSITKDSGGGD